MNFAQKLFALKSIRPFADLHDSELGTIVEVTRERLFEPHHVIAQTGSQLSRLYVIVEGGFVWGEEIPLPPVVGTPSLLFDSRLRHTLYSVSNKPTVCLTIEKGHFFTIVYECPSVLVGLFNWIRDEAIYER